MTGEVTLTGVGSVTDDALATLRAGQVVRILSLHITPSGDRYHVVLDVAPYDNEPPLIDGCRILRRGDGHYVCKVHYRYWPVGSGICPGRQP